MGTEAMEHIGRAATVLALSATVLALLHDTRMGARDEGERKPQIDEDLGKVIDHLHGAVSVAIRLAETGDTHIDDLDREVFASLPVEDEAIGMADAEMKRCVKAVRAREAYVPTPGSLALVRQALVCFRRMGDDAATREYADECGTDTSVMDAESARIARVIGMVDDLAAGRVPSTGSVS